MSEGSDVLNMHMHLHIRLLSKSCNPAWLSWSAHSDWTRMAVSTLFFMFFVILNTQNQAIDLKNLCVWEKVYCAVVTCVIGCAHGVRFTQFGIYYIKLLKIPKDYLRAVSLMCVWFKGVFPSIFSCNEILWAQRQSQVVIQIVQIVLFTIKILPPPLPNFTHVNPHQDMSHCHCLHWLVWILGESHHHLCKSSWHRIAC